jgi:UDP-2,4-diacetamido-2,4,6-trideoxy-beta-L-altropyranose hydrolase
MTKTNVLIITDGNNKIGLGHFYRTFSLSKELKKNRMNISFLTSKNKFLKNNLSKFGNHYTFSNNDEKDLEKIKKINPDIIIIDLLEKFFPYSIKFIKKLKNSCSLLTSIDFEGKGLQYIDLGFHTLFKPKKFHAKKSFIGFEFAIIRKEFLLVRKKYNFSKNINSIIILQGGADTHCISPKILQSIRTIPKHVKITLVLGPMFECHENLEKTIKALDRTIKLIFNSKKIHNEMKKHDIAITAAGNTMLELMLIGIPSLIICGEKHELKIANQVNRKKMALSIGYGKNITKNSIEKNFIKLLNDYKLRKKFHTNSKIAIDGNGTKKISQLILQNYRKSS